MELHMYYDLKESGKRIRGLRKQFKITQEALAEKLYLSVDSISNYENGKATCMPEHVAKLCEIFNVTADYIYYGRDKGISNRNDKEATILELLNECDTEDIERVEQMIRLFLRK